MAGRTSHPFLILIGLLLAFGASGAAQASGARQGVKARPGEIVLLRDVPTRPAYRMHPPGRALIVDPSPRRELAAALGGGDGIDELDEDAYASIDSAMERPASAHAGQTTVERVTSGMVGTTLGHAMGEGGMLSGAQLARTIGGPMGAVGGATRGIGDQVRGALAQFPLGQPAGPGGR